MASYNFISVYMCAYVCALELVSLALDHNHGEATVQSEPLFVCLLGFNVAFNIICHITTVSGCDRELNAHFYSAASLWYQIPDTFT